jgi:hypothetical protein
MRFRNLLAVAGLVLALGQVSGLRAAGLGGNPDGASIASDLGIDCELEQLAVFNATSDPESGLGVTGSGPFADQFIIQFTDQYSGTWALKDGADLGGFELKAWAAKGGTDWVGDVIGPGATSGTWSTAGLINGGGQQPAMSNLSFWGCESVPEPGTVLGSLLAVGLLALGRKRLA